MADESLEAIQDAVEELFEDHFEGSGGAADDSEVPEVNVASGVQWQYVRDDRFAGYTDYGTTLMAGVRARF